MCSTLAVAAVPQQHISLYYSGLPVNALHLDLGNGVKSSIAQELKASLCFSSRRIFTFLPPRRKTLSNVLMVAP